MLQPLRFEREEEKSLEITVDAAPVLQYFFHAEPV